MQEAGKRLGNRIRTWLGKLTGARLGYRMFLIYMIGSVLPIGMIGGYWIYGTNRILVQQVQDTEITELETIKRQLLENFDVMRHISQFFYFDEKLENIAESRYWKYQDMVDDFREYTAFQTYSNYYTNVISWIAVYLENDTLAGNSRFVKVDDTVKNSEWYRYIKEKGGGVAWRYMPPASASQNGLCLTRLIKTKESRDVGVLVMHLRDERLLETLLDREAVTKILLNGEKQIAENKSGPLLEQFQEHLPAKEKEGIIQKNIFCGGEDYLMTCLNVPLSESEDAIQIISLQPYRGILREVDKQSRDGVFLFLLSILVSIAMILLFSLSFSRRVNRFRCQMQKAAEGNFELEDRIGGRDEISELYEYLTTMIWKIQGLLADVYREQLHAEQLKTKQKDAEYKMLASQINPHFLYNTLETIRMKAREQGQAEIEELVKMLAKILRCNIQAGSQDVTIKSEVKLLEYYLKIQQYRFGERIQYHIAVDEELENKTILPLIMQPIVENSIIHGLESKEGDGNIYVLIQRKEDTISIIIEDDGLGMYEEKLAQLRSDLKSNAAHRRAHIGICNVAQRIRLKYGEAYGITIGSARGIGTKVEITIPLLAEEGRKEARV